METWVKHYKGYVIALIVEIFFLFLLKLPEALQGTKMCADNAVCGWSTAIVIMLLVPIPALMVYAQIDKRLHPIIQRWEHIYESKKQKVFTLTHSQKTDNQIIYLDLCNKIIEPNINVSEIEIGTETKIFSRRKETFILDKGKCREIPFVKISKFYKYFSIVDDIKETDFDQYKQGKYKFDISVMYGNGLVQWFEVVLSYIEPDKITLEIYDD